MERNLIVLLIEDDPEERIDSLEDTSIREDILFTPA